MWKKGGSDVEKTTYFLRANIPLIIRFYQWILLSPLASLFPIFVSIFFFFLNLKSKVFYILVFVILLKSDSELLTWWDCFRKILMSTKYNSDYNYLINGSLSLSLSLSLLLFFFSFICSEIFFFFFGIFIISSLWWWYTIVHLNRLKGQEFLILLILMVNYEEILMIFFNRVI